MTDPIEAADPADAIEAVSASIVAMINASDDVEFRRYCASALDAGDQPVLYDLDDGTIGVVLGGVRLGKLHVSVGSGSISDDDPVT